MLIVIGFFWKVGQQMKMELIEKVKKYGQQMDLGK
jgi:hypothetical protein